MTSFLPLLSVAHLLGLALGTGSATVKLVLLLQCLGDVTLVPAYLKVARLITRLIILGMILLTLSGIVWLVLGYDFSPLLIAKIILAATIWVLGPIIDNVVEPRFRELAPGPGGEVSPEFVRARSRYFAVELTATVLFYVIIVLWTWR